MKTLEVLHSSLLCHHVASGHCGQSSEISFNLKQRPLSLPRRWKEWILCLNEEVNYGRRVYVPSLSSISQIDSQEWICEDIKQRFWLFAFKCSLCCWRRLLVCSSFPVPSTVSAPPSYLLLAFTPQCMSLRDLFFTWNFAACILEKTLVCTFFPPFLKLPTHQMPPYVSMICYKGWAEKKVLEKFRFSEER